MGEGRDISEPLTQKDVDQLPPGVIVQIVWSGGNGPHQYGVVVEANGVRCVDTVYRDPIDFVGSESPFTVVRRVG